MRRIRLCATGRKDDFKRPQHDLNGESNALPKTADVVIVGAGVMGASIAFHLAQRKAGKDRRARQESCRERRQRAFVGSDSHALQFSCRSATRAHQPANISEHGRTWSGRRATFERRVSFASCIPMKRGDSSQCRDATRAGRERRLVPQNELARTGTRLDGRGRGTCRL